MRYLLLLALVVVGVLLWRRAIRQAPPAAAPGAEAEGAAESMVQCRICGVYLPLKESFKEGAFHYCSEAHRNQDKSS